MSIDTRKAIECFDENLKLFVSAQANPEKYNLYAGLLNTCRGIEDLERRLDTVISQLNRLVASSR